MGNSSSAKNSQKSSEGKVNENKELPDTRHHSRDPPYWIPLVGEPGAGKTAFQERFFNDQFLPECDPTETAESIISKTVSVDGKDVEVNIVDLSEQQLEFTSMYKSYFRVAVSFFLVYSIASRSSFEDLVQRVDYIKRIRDADSPSEIIVMVIGQKCDLEEQREVPTEDGVRFASPYDWPFYEVSAKASINAKEAFEDMIRLLRKYHVPYEPKKKS